MAIMALSDVGWNDGLHHSCLCSSDAVRLPLAASGLKNTFGQLAGFAAPIVLGLLTPYPDGLSREQFELQGTEPPEGWVTEMLFEWRSVFLLAAVIDSVGLLAYFAVGSGERQWWDVAAAPRLPGSGSGQGGQKAPGTADE